MKKHYIITCEDEEQSELVQIKILGQGYTWSEGGRLVSHTEKPVLVFDDLNNKKRSLSYHEKLMSEEYKVHSCYQKHEIISANEFLLLKKF